ncbi:LysR family transcriptional regulator [Corynebacterium sp.]|uniref:LysR family transcriptional regulator n=1 Tax=Corynebacterium sp. TaxID=1720 RepID=UPI0026DF8D12|nr:LysR family transcriptional regulator [Corynebacterium sp.]MDO5512561.1 LysR family transcriptional regulator [Corynebacterium sp.]
MNGKPVNLSNVDLNLLVSLHALLEEQSVTGAADRVGLSQPAMSHALRRIRSLIDDPVLVRDGSRSILTPRAQGLLGPLRDILHRTSGLLGGESFDPATSTRSITVAMSPTVAYILAPALTRLLAREAPGVGLRVLTTYDTSDAVFTGERADVMLLAEGYVTDHPRERLFDDEWVVIAGTPELSTDTVVDVLWTWPHVVLDAPQLPRPYELLRHRGIDIDVQVRVNDWLLIPQFVAGERRVALHRRRAMDRLGVYGGLTVVPFPFPLLGLGVDMVWNPWLGDDSFRGWLRDLLVQAVSIRHENGSN